MLSPSTEEDNETHPVMYPARMCTWGSRATKLAASLYARSIHLAGIRARRVFIPGTFGFGVFSRAPKERVDGGLPSSFWH